MKYKRLTKYNEYTYNAEVHAFTVGNEDVYFDGVDIVGNENSNLAQETIDKLAELEDKIENGELVENKVVTYISTARCGGKMLVDKALKYDALKAKIENGTFIELPCMQKTVFGNYRVTFFSKMFNCIDTEVFFNKAEAEKKLKELQGKNEIK